MKKNRHRTKFVTPGWALLTVAAFCLSGCGESNGLIKVTGTVTVDGELVPEGSISFMPVNGKGVTAGGQIKNGKYFAEVSPGEMAVQIYATKELEKENPTQEEIERGITSDPVQYIPEKYNKASTLRVNVSDSSRQHDFDLTSSGDDSSA